MAHTRQVMKVPAGGFRRPSTDRLKGRTDPRASVRIPAPDRVRPPGALPGQYLYGGARRYLDAMLQNLPSICIPTGSGGRGKTPANEHDPVLP